jgi:hypothetical protein
LFIAVAADDQTVGYRGSIDRFAGWRKAGLVRSASTSAAEEFGIVTSRSSSAWPQSTVKYGHAS